MNHEKVKVKITNNAVVPVAPMDHHSHRELARLPTL